MVLTVDIEKRLNPFALRVKFETNGGTLSLLGASGSGKTMILKCIAGLEKPDKGKIVLDGRVLFDSEKKIDLPPQKRRVGYLFQQYALFPHMTVEQNIRAGVRTKESAAAVSKMLQTMGLSSAAHLYPRQLSGGEQQRVALARILVNEPDILLLDEPFSALDAHLRFRMEQEVRRIISLLGKPVILVSHDRDEVYRFSDQVAIIHNGHVETTGTKEDVFRCPRTKNAAILTGCKNISPLQKLSERRIFALDWNMELETAEDVGDAQYVGIRMHSITPGAGENTLSCRVTEVVENPFSQTLMLERADCPGKVPIGWETDKSPIPAVLDVSFPKNGLLLLAP